ncbi:MAG: SpoIIE family protein phosphatase [Verrucomicrobiota bacterium]
MPNANDEILIVDDDNLSRRLLVRNLVAAGYVCTEADGGAAAVARIRERPPRLLLLDYDMPEVDGAEVLQKIRSDPSAAVAQLPTIMLTGHGGEESEVLCLAAGADDFVTKPILPAVLRARIETQLRLRMMREQLMQQNEELEAWRQRLEQDLAAARLTQQSLIPQHPPALPGWEVASYYRPVIQVGGDIYGWLRMTDGRFLFWIADATGHGAAAALLTTVAKLLFHHAAVEHSAPAEIMGLVDRDFRSILGARSFMTAMCVALDPETGDASVVGAGHPPLLVARGNRATEVIGSESPPLGLAGSTSFRETAVQLGKGDLFLLYTDGLYGSFNGKHRRTTPDDLAHRMQMNTTSAVNLLNRVVHESGENNGNQVAADDIAALAVRRQANGK